MLNLKKLETEINEYLINSGDDINDVTNHGLCLIFSHIALIKINFSSDVLIKENGEIEINVKKSNESFLNLDVSGATSRILLETKTAKKGNVSNIQDVIAFIMSWNGEEMIEETKMREIVKIQMATDNDIYTVTFGEHIEIKADGGGYVIMQGKDEAEWFATRDEAESALNEYLVDEILITTGYGKNAGRKFWQLPEAIQNEVMEIARS